jgi:hypothetical protein
MGGGVAVIPGYMAVMDCSLMLDMCGRFVKG